MSIPRFSIVIPTRNRSQTLYYSLKTCLTQDFTNFEIVVSDNCGTPETKQTVESFESDKIKYIRSDVPLAMSDNWELAISHADGEYVIIIGDDDGLLPNALTDIDFFITTTDAKAIRWAMATYMWPDVQGGLAANKLHIPAHAQSMRIDSHEAIEAVLKGKKNYSFLPMLYYSAIHKDIIQTLKNKTGKVFKGSSSPDVYSAFTIGYIAQTHCMIGKPLGIVGYSGKSNGVATLIVKEETQVSKEFNQLNALAGQSFYQQVPNLPVIAAATANEFLNAKQALFPDDNRFTFDRKQVIINCIKDLQNFNRVGEKEWATFIEIIMASLSDDKNLHDWFELNFLQHAPKGTAWAFSQEAWQDGLTTDSLFLDGTTFGVSDVFGAAELCGKLIGQTVSFSDLTDLPESSLNLHQQLIDKEDVIQQFHQELLAKEQVINSFRTLIPFWLVNGPLFRMGTKIKQRLTSFLSPK